MQFETKLIDGKPSIFFKDGMDFSFISIFCPLTNHLFSIFLSEPEKTAPLKKLNTKDKRIKKDIRKSMEIPGEVDLVKPSPRDGATIKNQKINIDPKSLHSLKQKGLNLSEEQLLAILNVIQNNNNPAAHTNSKQQEMVQNISNNNFEDGQFNSGPNSKSNSMEQLNVILKRTDKKKLKWQQDRELEEQLTRQEHHDNEIFRQAYEKQTNRSNPDDNPNRTGNTPDPKFFKSTLTLAERKRLEWQQEKGIHFHKKFYFQYK
jgi:hypothetical protein